MPGNRRKLQKSGVVEAAHVETLEKQPLMSDVISDVIASLAGVQEEVLEYCTLDETTEKDVFGANVNLDVWQNTISEHIDESQDELSGQDISDPEHRHVSEIQTLYSGKDAVTVQDKQETLEKN